MKEPSESPMIRPGTSAIQNPTSAPGTVPTSFATFENIWWRESPIASCTRIEVSCMKKNHAGTISSCTIQPAPW